MRYLVNTTTLELLRGDIVVQDVDAIVNAANTTLLGGGGVDGAIHRAAGPGLLAECVALGGCPTGEARLTGGHRLKARFVIHTVGPVYSGQPEDAALLAAAYRNSLALTRSQPIASIAFPSISTGAYGYPLDEAAPVALQAVADYLAEETRLTLVRFVLWDQRTLAAYQQVAERLFGGQRL